MAFLTAMNGPQAGKQYELAAGEYVLGRHPDCHIVIDVGAVSRHHCKVLAQDAHCLLEDMQSRNGTFVNDQEINGPHRLVHGDRIRVCDVVFKFHATESPPETGSLDDSSYRAVMVEDDVRKSTSTIMSKMDVLSSHGSVQMRASAESRLHALIEITQSLGKALSLDKVLPEVLDSLFRIFMQADRGFIGLVDASGHLVPRWTKLRREDSDETIRISRTIANEVLRSKEAILSADATDDPRFDMSQSVADFRIRSMMCAPLINGDGEAIGMLQIDTVDQRHRFQEEDLALLVSTASQAAIAIDNAQLHEETVRQRTLERDLELARDVQRAFLPRSRPQLDGYDFFDYYRAANHVGGDSYDYVPLADGRLAIVVADVVGHGVAAAMLMAKLSAEVRFCAASAADAAAAVTQVNRNLCQLNLERFVTLVMAVLDPKSHEVTIASAGHMPPISRGEDGTLDEPGRGVAGVPLGIVDAVEYGQARLTLAPGQSLTMFTDGLDESVNPQKEQFSIERIRDVVQNSDGSPADIGESILHAVRQHMEDEPQDDDMCLVSFRRIR